MSLRAELPLREGTRTAGSPGMIDASSSPPRGAGSASSVSSPPCRSATRRRRRSGRCRAAASTRAGCRAHGRRLLSRAAMCAVVGIGRRGGFGIGATSPRGPRARAAAQRGCDGSTRLTSSSSANEGRRLRVRVQVVVVVVVGHLCREGALRRTRTEAGEAQSRPQGLADGRRRLRVEPASSRGGGTGCRARNRLSRAARNACAPLRRCPCCCPHRPSTAARTAATAPPAARSAATAAAPAGPAPTTAARGSCPRPSIGSSVTAPAACPTTAATACRSRLLLQAAADEAARRDALVRADVGEVQLEGVGHCISQGTPGGFRRFRRPLVVP